MLHLHQLLERDVTEDAAAVLGGAVRQWRLVLDVTDNSQSGINAQQTHACYRFRYETQYCNTYTADVLI